MSVIVKGMEMPGDCWYCAMNRLDVCEVVGRTYDPDPGQPKRPNWCPLRPMPENHGRLIDADEATRRSLERTGKRLLAIDTAPTVVEAEGE